MKFYIDLGARIVILLALLSLLQGEFIMAYVALYIGYWVMIANLLQIKKIRWGLFMDWEKGCYNGNYFDLVEEKEDRYICKCEFCDNEFTKWKQEEKEED